VCSAPWLALDFGSSLLTLVVAVTLALGTSSPRPEWTLLERRHLTFLRSQGLQSISHRLVVFQQDGYTTLTVRSVIHTQYDVFSSTDERQVARYRPDLPALQKLCQFLFYHSSRPTSFDLSTNPLKSKWVSSSRVGRELTHQTRLWSRWPRRDTVRDDSYTRWHHL